MNCPQNLANKVNILCGKIKSLSTAQDPAYISLNILDNIPDETFTINQYIMDDGVLPVANRVVNFPMDIPFNTAFDFERTIYQKNVDVSGTDIIIRRTGDYVLLYSQIYETSTEIRNMGDIVIVVNGEIKYIGRGVIGGSTLTLNFPLQLSNGDIVNIYNAAFLDEGEEIILTFRPYDFINVTLVRLS